MIWMFCSYFRNQDLQIRIEWYWREHQFEYLMVTMCSSSVASMTNLSPKGGSEQFQSRFGVAPATSSWCTLQTKNQNYKNNQPKPELQDTMTIYDHRFVFSPLDKVLPWRKNPGSNDSRPTTGVVWSIPFGLDWSSERMWTWTTPCVEGNRFFSCCFF